MFSSFFDFLICSVDDFVDELVEVDDSSSSGAHFSTGHGDKAVEHGLWE